MNVLIMVLGGCEQVIVAPNFKAVSDEANLGLREGVTYRDEYQTSRQAVVGQLQRQTACQTSCSHRH